MGRWERGPQSKHAKHLVYSGQEGEELPHPNMSGYFSKITDTVSNAITPQTKLSLWSKNRYIQEKLGTLSDDISKLPPQYLSLERKTDALLKICKRILMVTSTFEITGYDYPPNLTESISSWWDKDSSFNPHSMAHALSNVAEMGHNEFEHIPRVADDDDDDDNDEIKVLFESWASSYRNIDQAKTDMDSMIKTEFNMVLQKKLDTMGKKIDRLRHSVHDSRLKFDTLRHELKSTPTPSEEDTKLLEQLEDEFVSNTAQAVETMQEFNDSAEFINLIKIFQNLQLVYHRQCVQEIEANLDKLSNLE